MLLERDGGLRGESVWGAAFPHQPSADACRRGGITSLTMPSAPRNVPRLANLLDLGGTALLAIGGVCYARAWFGLEAIRANTAVRPAGGPSALGEYERLWELSRTGIWVGVAGLIVLAGSAAYAWYARRSAPVPVPATEPSPEAATS